MPADHGGGEVDKLKSHIHVKYYMFSEHRKTSQPHLVNNRFDGGENNTCSHIFRLSNRRQSDCFKLIIIRDNIDLYII